MPNIEYKSLIPTSAQELFDWHSRPGAFERLVPPWENIQVIERQGTITDGSRMTMKVMKGPISLKWVAHHYGYKPGEQFCDEQVRGPFAKWVHTHRFLPEPDDESASTLHDAIEYKLPLSPISDLIAGRINKAMLDRMFAFRHKRTRCDLLRHSRTDTKLSIAITGASGLVGTQLSAFLTTGGHSVTPITRRSAPGAITWNPAKGQLSPDDLEGFDAIIHLAGANIGTRWTPKAKEMIRSSRVDGTRLLCETIAKLNRKPRVLLSASAIGYYGDRGDELLTEESAPGSGFLASVCQVWEEATAPARDANVRVAYLRTGIVMTAAGGALGKQLLPFKLGLGGPVGSGQQFQSWIALDDLLGAIHHIMLSDLEGPINMVAPTPIPQKQFAQTLGRVLKRPAFMPLPAVALKLMLGEMGEELLLSSNRVVPNALLESGFEFFFPELEEAFAFELGR